MKLLSEHEDVLAEFSSGQVAVPPDSDDEGWIQVSLEAPGGGAREREGGAHGNPAHGTRVGQTWRRGVEEGPRLGNRGGRLKAGKCAGLGRLGEAPGP